MLNNKKNILILIGLFVICGIIGYKATSLLKQKEKEEPAKTIIPPEKEDVDTLCVHVNEDDTLSTGGLAQEAPDQNVQKQKVDNNPVVTIPQNEPNNTNDPSKPINTVKVVDQNPDENPDEDISAKKAAADDAKKAEEEKIQQIKLAQDKLRSEVQSIVVSGQRSSKVPSSCLIKVNDSFSIDYENFCIGLGNGAYSNVRVNSVKFDKDGKVSSVSVSATVNQSDE